MPGNEATELDGTHTKYFFNSMATVVSFSTREGSINIDQYKHALLHFNPVKLFMVRNLIIVFVLYLLNSYYKSLT